MDVKRHIIEQHTLNFKIRDTMVMTSSSLVVRYPRVFEKMEEVRNRTAIDYLQKERLAPKAILENLVEIYSETVHSKAVI